jgi:DNA-binding response OmpR family regulator
MPELNSSRPASVLVIDDKADLLVQIRQLLEEEGFEVATAQSGKAALQALDDEPRLVVLDISMPDMGGLEILEAVRRRQPDSLIIFMTAKKEMDQAERALSSGAFDFVQMPVAGTLDAIAKVDLIVRCRRAVRMIQLKSQDRYEGMVQQQPTFASGAARPERAAMERAAFSRIVTFVERAVSKTSTRTLEQALSETGPSMAMTDVLSEALLEDTSEGRWAQALLRGAQVKRELLEAAGGSLSVNQVGTLLGISRAAVDKRRRQGALLGLKLPSGDITYPAAQFSKDDVLPGLPEILGSFRIQDAWMQLDVLLAHDESQSGRTLFEALAHGDVEVVKSRVSSFGDQGL